jgi:pyrrolidone-carboxylate peptidase
MTLAPRRSSIVDREVEVRADLVHLVDEADARDVVLVGLAPDRLGLGLDALLAVEDGDGAVEDAQRALDLDGEVDVAGVSMMLIWLPFQKQVVAAEVMVMPRSCSCSIQSIVAAPSCTSPIL